MPKSVTVILIVILIAGGLGVAYRFGSLGWDQLIYLGNLIGGWTAWVVIAAIVYAGLEKLFPGLLCTPAEDVTPSPPKEGS